MLSVKYAEDWVLGPHLDDRVVFVSPHAEEGNGERADTLVRQQVEVSANFFNERRDSSSSTDTALSDFNSHR